MTCWTFFKALLVGALISCGSLSLTHASDDLTTIQLDKPLHVFTADQSDYILTPGSYRVSARGTDTLLVVSSSGATTLVSAVAFPHKQSIAAPRAVLIQDTEDLLHIVLMLQDGQALDAVGSFSGIRERGALSAGGGARFGQALTPGAAAALQPVPTVTLSPAQGPSGTMVKITVSNFPLPPANFSQMRDADIKVDSTFVQSVRLLPCSKGGLGLGEDCGTPPLTVKMDGPPGGKKTVIIETGQNILLGSPYASAMFTIDVAPAVGQTQIGTPTLALSPTGGPPGSLVEVSACGYPANLERRLAKLSLEGVARGTVVLGRCPDGSAGFGSRAVSPGSIPRAVIIVDGPPGPKTIQAQVESNPGPPGIATFLISPLPPVAIAPRFQPVLDGLAVLDKDTGLTWERFPEVIARDAASFFEGRQACHRKVIAGRIGWRFPTLDELSSLVDKTQSNPSLAPGHPFLLPQFASQLWTTTVELENANVVYSLDILHGDIRPLPTTQNGRFVAWCVRGIPGPERQ